MPVADHPVHEKTIQATDAHYQCWNKPRDFSGYWAPDGHVVEAIGYGDDQIQLVYVKMKWVEFRNSRECRYDFSLTDQMCDKCQHRGSGEAYNEFIRRNGT